MRPLDQPPISCTYWSDSLRAPLPESCPRFPSVSMEPDRHEVEELFEAALELPAEERASWLLERCGGKDALLADVKALLLAHDRAEGILEADAVGAGALLIDTPMRGRRIGQYRLLRELGRGGMGVVYLAERDDGHFRRRVAVKLLRASPDAEELHRRFVAERQILASLEHPNIAQLLDGGVTDGELPYLVMEYVDGLPITAYCDRHRLSIDERLRLFRDACAAVHHAHRNLVIHRDLKPSNILIATDGKVKLLDFGIAKLLNPAISAMDLPETRTAFRVLTPEYASPEQLRGESLTTASDVYALGVVLYELLTARRPHAADTDSPAVLAREICESEPDRPSTTVLRAHKIRPDAATGELTPASVSAARDTTPERLSRELRGDLDAIVMMALRKEPARRYGSADLLAADVQRYHDGLPVVAHRGSRRYRAGKLIRRHRLAVAAAAVVALSLLGGAAVAGWQAGIASRERDRAEAALRESEEVTSFLLGLFEASDPEARAGVEITSRELLRRGTERAEQLAGEPDVQARLFGVLGRVHLSLGEYEPSERLLERSLELQMAHLGPDHGDVVTTLARLADVERQLGRYDSAQTLLERALSTQRRSLGDNDPALAATVSSLASLAVQRGDLATAEELAREALNRRRALGRQHPSVVADLARLGSILRQRGDLAGAEGAYREALQLRESTRGAAASDMVGGLLQLADLLQTDSSREREAESLYRRALEMQLATGSPDHNSTAAALYGLARLLERRGAREEAVSAIRDVQALQRRIYGEEHPRSLAALAHLAGLLHRSGRLADSETAFRTMAQLQRSTLGEAHPSYAGTLTALSAVLIDAGRLTEADSLLSVALAIRIARLGPEHLLVARTLRRRAQVQIGRGNFASADSLLKRAMAVARAQTTADAQIGRDLHATMAELHEAWGRPEEAERYRLLARGSSGAPTVPASEGTGQP